MYEKYVRVLAECANVIFTEMTGTQVLDTRHKRDERTSTSFPVAQVISYDHRNEGTLEGHFLLGFTDRKMAVQVASSVAIKMGLEPFRNYNDTAADILGEFINTVVGRTIATWDRLGMPVRFGPPSALQHGSLGELEEYRTESYVVILDVESSQIIFQVSFSEPQPEPLEKKRILVTEDSDVVRSLVCQTLIGGGFEVAQAADGLEAVERYQEFNPALTVMDLVMPTLDGFGAMKAIREVDPEARFIILTSSSRQDDVAQAQEMEVSAYLIKPFKGEALLKAVRDVLMS